MANKTYVMVGAEILNVDWIMHQDKAWLVPEWILSPDGKSMRPRRIISLALADGYSMKLGEAPLAYFQSNPIPKSLLEKGELPNGLEKAFEVLEEPEIWIPNPEYSH